MTTPIQRSQVIAYRARVHDLETPARDAAECGVLGVGVQDSPAGRTAHLALRPRSPATATRQRVIDGDLPLVYSSRGAMHVHRADDLGLLAAALRPDGNDAPSVMSFGPFARELTGQGVDLPTVLDQVAEAMRGVAADGEARTKGELSTAVTPLVDRRVAPWCEGCQAHHVPDGPWRYATLQAGLRLAYDSSPGGFRLVRARVGSAERDKSRRTLTVRFLHLFGPAAPSHLGGWLGLSPAGASRWWRLVEDDLVPVRVDGAARWVRPEDLEPLRQAPPPTTTVLLPPYDPITELADRELLVPQRAVRKQIWRPAASPGVVLARGELAGTWRQRTRRDRLELTVTTFREPDRGAVEAEARRLAETMGLTGATVQWQEA